MTSRTSLFSRRGVQTPTSGARTRRLLLVSALAVGSCVPLLGQFVVFDPTNYGQALQQFAQLQQQYVQLVQTYRLLTTQATALTGDLNARYRSMATPWLSLIAADTYGVTAGWVHTANTGHDPQVGYQSATQPLQTYESALGHMPADEAGRVKGAYGGVELSDGVTMHALEMLGYLRGHSGDVEFALRRLEDDSYSTDPTLNTEVAVLNKVNAAAVTSARLTKDSNQVLIAILEQQLLQARRQRDADAVALDAHIAFETHARDLLQQSSAGTADALANFRLP
jgi:hypothetical protein